MSKRLITVVSLEVFSENGEDNALFWNSEGLLVRQEAPLLLDRYSHPYDVDAVPPAWTPTPSHSMTPLPTWTPRPESFWVADMQNNRVVRVTYHGKILGSTYVDYPASSPTWSPLEHCDVIAPNAVSAANDGSCWAIDWARESVVKISPQGTVVARTTPNPTPWATPLTIQHPVALDCAGDSSTCFVADFEGNNIYKLTLSGSQLTLQPSAAQYFRPSAVKAQRDYQNNELVEFVWVLDRMNPTPISTPFGTWTPYPTATPTPYRSPTPTVGPGTPTNTPHPQPPQSTETPSSEFNRVSRNRFISPLLRPEYKSAIPVGLSVFGTENDVNCWIADRNAGVFPWNQLKRVRIIEGAPTMIPYSGDSTHPISLPVDAEIIH